MEKFKDPNNLFEKNSTEYLLREYFKDISREKQIKIVEFIESFSEIPTEPEEAFLYIHNRLIDSGFQYDNSTFLLEEVIENKKGNCLGLSILFGIILKHFGLAVQFEIATAPHDAHYREDLRQFERLAHGEIFSYESPPELPNEKSEFPQNWFVPLEHPIIVLNGEYFETTSLLSSENTDVRHSYDSEAKRDISFENLLGAMYMSSAKTRGTGPRQQNDSVELIVSTAKKALILWPDDKQGLMYLRDLAIFSFDDKTKDECEKRVLELSGTDSLSQYNQYKITKNEVFLKNALSTYPPFIAAYIEDKIHLPLKDEGEKKEARFDFTVAAMCVANSSELDLDLFYLEHIDIIVAAFSEEYAKELLYDLEIDNKWPTQYQLAMFRITRNPDFLLNALESGVIEESSPLETYHICRYFLDAINNGFECKNEDVVRRCKKNLEDIEDKYSDSAIFISAKKEHI